MLQETPLRVLIVDDEPLAASALRRALRQRAWIVEVETSGHRAIERHRLERFDVVITDLVMPEIDGLAVIQAMRNIAAATIIIGISGDPMRAVADHAEPRGGADAIVAKPIAVAELLATIAATRATG